MKERKKMEGRKKYRKKNIKDERMKERQRNWKEGRKKETGRKNES